MSDFDIDFEDCNFECLAEFGDLVTYAPISGDPAYSLTGILQSPSILESGAPGTYFHLSVNQNDLAAAPASGDRVTVGARTFAVFEIDADLGGMARLKLQLQ